MDGNTDDIRNFIPPPPAAAGSSASDATATAHMVGVGGGFLKPHCYPKKVRRKSSKVNQIMGGSTSKQAKYPKKPPLTPEAEADAPKIARPCSECGKKFWSWKALFGHMRCHPERQWRGINPPPNFRRPSPSPSHDDRRQHCYDASSSSSTLTTWPRDHDDDECGLSSPPGSGGYYYYYYSSEKTMGGGGGGGGMTEEDHEVASCLLLLANNALDHHYSSGDQFKLNPQQEGAAGRNSDGGVGRGTIREEDDEMINIQNHRHTCSICSRVFSSGRALGGHKRFHCSSRDKFRGGNDNAHIHHPPIICSSSSTNNYLDFNLNLVPTPTPAPAPHHQDHSSSAAPLPSLDLSLGL